MQVIANLSSLKHSHVDRVLPQAYPPHTKIPLLEDVTAKASRLESMGAAFSDNPVLGSITVTVLSVKEPCPPPIMYAFPKWTIGSSKKHTLVVLIMRQVRREEKCVV